jgi:hypothetical protein
MATGPAAGWSSIVERPGPLSSRRALIPEDISIVSRQTSADRDEAAGAMIRPVYRPDFVSTDVTVVDFAYAQQKNQQEAYKTEEDWR